MPSREQLRWAQLRVGLTVIFASIVLALVIFLVSGTGGVFSSKVSIYAYFENAAGVRVGAPVKLELSRRDDFLGMHGRWPTVHYYKVAADNDGSLQAIQLRGYSSMGGYRKNSGSMAGIELYKVANVDSSVSPVGFSERAARSGRHTPTASLAPTLRIHVFK